MLRFQKSISNWLVQTFGEKTANDKLERSDRFLEETIELLQSVDYPKERLLKMVDIVYAKRKGDTPQEIGGVVVTLASFCHGHGYSMHRCAIIEENRIWEPEIMHKIQEKQAIKEKEWSKKLNGSK